MAIGSDSDLQGLDRAVLSNLFDALLDGLQILLTVGDELTPLLECRNHLVKVQLAGLHLADQRLELRELVFELHIFMIISYGGDGKQEAGGKCAVMARLEGYGLAN